MPTMKNRTRKKTSSTEPRHTARCTAALENAAAQIVSLGYRLKEAKATIVERETERIEAQDFASARVRELSEAHHKFELAEKFLNAKVEDLEERLMYERRRMSMALETANNTSEAAAAIGRITNHVSDLVQSLETRLWRENKEAGKKTR